MTTGVVTPYHYAGAQRASRAISCCRALHVRQHAWRFKSHLKGAAVQSVRLHGLGIRPRRWTTSRRLFKRDRSAELTTKPRSPQTWQWISLICTMTSPWRTSCAAAGEHGILLHGRPSFGPAPNIPASRTAPIPAPIAAVPVARFPLATLPGTLADVPADYWTQAAMVALSVLALLAIVLIGKGPRWPKTHFGPA